MFSDLLVGYFVLFYAQVLPTGPELLQGRDQVLPLGPSTQNSASTGWIPCEMVLE